MQGPSELDLTCLARELVAMEAQRLVGPLPPGTTPVNLHLVRFSH